MNYGTHNYFIFQNYDDANEFRNKKHLFMRINIGTSKVDIFKDGEDMTIQLNGRIIENNRLRLELLRDLLRQIETDVDNLQMFLVLGIKKVSK